jgi:hypothetical protein
MLITLIKLLLKLKIILGSYHPHLPWERGTGGGEAEFKKVKVLQSFAIYLHDQERT